ncbi:MAG: cation:proton antiporter [Chloroflexi bacterium]|nr:cation:proton antiporter [Chloroflexota bacterium]
MSPTLQLLLVLSIVIFAAKTGGLISTRLHQPAVLGELLAGLVLGPTLLNIFGLPIFTGAHTDELILELGELGVIFLMFMAGMEVDLDEMLKAGRVAMLAGILGVIVPLILGTVIALAFSFTLTSSIFIGLILTATSVSISAQTLLELGVLRGKEGLALLGAAVIDDVLVILLLSIFVSLTGESGVTGASIIADIARMALYFALATVFGVTLIPRLAKWIEKLPVSEGMVAFVVMMTFVFAWSAEALGKVAAITGAFLAGLAFARTTMRHTIIEGMHTLTYGFFVPIFLISIGLKTNARALGIEGIFFALAIIAVAILGKIGGCWLGARWGGFAQPEALRVAVGMVSRGEVGLIVAGVGLSTGLTGPNVYSAMVIMVLATTLVTPILLRQVFPNVEASNG